jgi:hypothetical protein
MQTTREGTQSKRGERNMSNDITLEQIEERLVPILQKICLVHQPRSTGEERKKWEEIYSPLYSLFLDISIAADHNKPKDPRETQFRGYTELLMNEIKDRAYIDSGEEDIYEAIVRHAYDLVKHTVEHIDPKDLDVLGIEETVHRIPDLTEWTEEDNNATIHPTR